MQYWIFHEFAWILKIQILIINQFTEEKFAALYFLRSQILSDTRKKSVKISVVNDAEKALSKNKKYLLL